MYRSIFGTLCVLFCILFLPLQAHLPTAVAAGTITAVELGTFHTCVIKSGQVWCWGANSGYQLGDGTSFERMYPVQTLKEDGTPLSGVTKISAGYDHTCAIASKQVWCWGNNIVGELGNGTTSLGSMRAVKAKKNPAAGGGFLDNATDIATGTYHTCAVQTGQVWCWGSNRNNQIGAGSSPNTDGAYRVTIMGGGWLPAVHAIGAANVHTCAVTTTGGVWCWGGNYWAELGDGTEIDRNRAVKVVYAGSRISVSGMRNVSVGDGFSCATNAAGNMWCWGTNLSGQLSTTTFVGAYTGAVQSKFGNRTNISRMTGIDVGGSHGCGIYNGYAACWGYNGDGALGNDSIVTANYPVTVSYEDAAGRLKPLTNVTSISGGFRHSCAVVNQTQVWCWGRNANYQLADGTNIYRHTAVRVLKSPGVFFP